MDQKLNREDTRQAVILEVEIFKSLLVVMFSALLAIIGYTVANWHGLTTNMKIIVIFGAYLAVMSSGLLFFCTYNRISKIKEGRY